MNRQPRVNQVRVRTVGIDKGIDGLRVFARGTERGTEQVSDWIAQVRCFSIEHRSDLVVQGQKVRRAATVRCFTMTGRPWCSITSTWPTAP